MSTIDHAASSVLVTWPDYDLEDPRAGGALVDAGLSVRLAPKLAARTTSELLGLTAGVAAAIVSTDPFDAAVLSASPDLRVIARVGVGHDSIDLAAATERGVAVTITPGANEAAVADHTIALVLAVLRRIVEQDSAVRRGDWQRTGPALPWQLSGATVGLVGYGRIGRLVAERLRGFSANVLYTDPRASASRGSGGIELEELLRRSDVVSLHAPLMPGTRHLIGAPELALMPPHAVLVNTARGSVIDEAALAFALAAGRLRGAGLDVFEHEPPRDSPLLGLPNVVLSAHVGGLSEPSVREMTRRATASVLDVLAGRRPSDLANPDLFEPRTATKRTAEFDGAMPR